MALQRTIILDNPKPSLRQKLEVIKPKTKIKQTVEYDCEKCGLYKRCKRPEIGIEGERHKLLFIEDIPNEMVDGGGYFFKGGVGDIFKEELKGYKDYPKTYAIECYSHGPASEAYAKCCRNKMAEIINVVKPTVIISFGEITINSLLNTPNKVSIHALRGRIIPLHEFNCVVMPTLNSKEFRQKDEERPGKYKDNYAKKDAHKRDLLHFINRYENGFNSRKHVEDILKRRNIFENSSITQIKSITQLISLSEILREKNAFAFDYETTTTKPYDEDFDIVSLCFAHEKNAWVVYLPQFKGELDHAKHITLGLLNNPNILKIIQNKQFEESSTRWWCKDIIDEYNRNDLGQIIHNYFDTMLASHIVDEREGCTSLDFQTLVRFGLTSFYDKHKMGKWIKAAKGQRINKVKECPPELLIEYTGHDGIETYANWKALIGKNMLGQSENYEWCLNFISEGCDVFSNMSERGIPVNKNLYKKKLKQLEDINDKIIEQISNDSDIKGFKKSRGKDLNVQSPKQMRDFLYNYLKLKPVKKTKGGKKGIKEEATDASVILHHAEVDNVPFCRMATKKKKLKKAFDVLNGIDRWTMKDGRMHPGLWMNTTETMRSSSSDLNIQNIPVHGFIIEDEDWKIPWESLREVFERDGQDWIIAEVDFERNEVVGAANISGDKQLIEDINTDFDMHSHWTNVIFGWNHPFEAYKKDETPEDKALANFRYLTKNNWTFANFYKAGAKSIAESFRKFSVYVDFLFKEYEKKKRSEIFEKWIIKRSEDHIGECQNFFYDRYSTFKMWQDEQIQFYKENGYIETPLGFRRHYPLQATEIVNNPIQATSYHILLDACIRIEKRLIKEERRSSQRAQIHDSDWLMIYLPEILDIIELVNYEMTNHNLPNVPKLAKLGTDWKVGVNWGQMKKISSLL